MATRLTLMSFSLGVVFLLAGCSMQSSIVYEVTGTASQVDVTYSNQNEGTSQESGLSLPWQKSFSVPALSDQFLYISAQNQGSSGSVTVSIYVDGERVEQSSSSGAYVIATASRLLSD